MAIIFNSALRKKYYENLVYEICENPKIKSDSFSSKFLASVTSSPKMTTKQFELLKNILNRYGIDHTGYELRDGLRESLRELNDEIRFFGDNVVLLTNSNKDYDAKKAALTDMGAEWNHTDRYWILKIISREIFNDLINFSRKYDYNVDEDTIDFFARCMEATELKSVFLVDPDNDRIVANICADPLLEQFVILKMLGHPV